MCCCACFERARARAFVALCVSVARGIGDGEIVGFHAPHDAAGDVVEDEPREFACFAHDDNGVGIRGWERYD